MASSRAKSAAGMPGEWRKEAFNVSAGVDPGAATMRIAPLCSVLAVLVMCSSARPAATTQPAAGQPATRPAATRPAATRPAIYIDPVTGFSIVPPKFTDAPQRMVVFYAPPQNGVTATVNILTDAVRTTRREYVDQSLRNLKRTDAKINSSRELQVAGFDAALLDYEATMNVRRMRYLQLLVISEDVVYIITCQSPAESFEQYKDAFQKCLDSFRPPAK
jgi:hypothetical protein